MSDIDYMNECMTRDLVVMMMEEQGMSMTEAMDAVLLSDTYAKLQDPRTGLYFQSPVYIYDLLMGEIKTGKLGR